MKNALAITICLLLLSIAILCHSIVTKILSIQNQITSIDSYLQELQTVLPDTDIQTNLDSLSSELYNIKNVVSDTKSSMSKVEKKVFSLEQSHYNIMEKMKQLNGENALEQYGSEIDVTELPKPLYRDQLVNTRQNSSETKQIRFEEKVINSFGKRENPKPEAHLPTTKEKYSDKVSRMLQPNTDNVFCDNLFRLVIRLDRDVQETSWDLFSSLTNQIVAGETRMPRLQRGTPYVFETCIDPGFHTFTIYDSFGDGINCGKDSCYTLFINDAIIDGIVFSSKQSHQFSASFLQDDTVCVGYPLNIVADLGSQSSANWTLQTKETNVVIDSQNIENHSPNTPYNYTTCVETGIYTFFMSDSDGNGLDCDETNGRCFKLFLNNLEIIQSPPFFFPTFFHFFVTIDGRARESKSNLNPILSPINQVTSDGYNVRVEKIMNVIQRLSSGNDLDNILSPQNKAAKFILFEDPLEITADDPSLIERYAFSVFLYATNQATELHLPHETCKHVNVKCGSLDHIIELNFGKNFIYAYHDSEANVLSLI